jgi:serpin B
MDLYRTQAAETDGNLILSPYSIGAAMAMVYAGADGATKTEMQKALHLPADEQAAAQGFATLGKQLVEMTRRGSSGARSQVTIANRLFVQKDKVLSNPFVRLLADVYQAPLKQLDFRTGPDKARARINEWVQTNTNRKIRDLIPLGGVTKDTGTVLANAIHLHADWEEAFSKEATASATFMVRGKSAADVATMRREAKIGYAKHFGWTAVSLPYAGDALALVILLPDAKDGLTKLEKKVSAGQLASLAKLPQRDVDLSLPKFRIQPPTVGLAEALKSLGMKTAFDLPQGSANLDRMAPRRVDDYLYLSEVFHKAYLTVDEKGTEAGAATAAVMESKGIAEPNQQPIAVRVDHPFLFAIQHVPSGTCLFLGRVTDPR